MTTQYTCTGSVRGNCGHKHRTISAAVRCLRKDQAGCKSQHGYSDRAVRAIEGNGTRRLNETEAEEMYAQERR